LSADTESVDHVAVTVTFLRMEAPPVQPAPPLPADADIRLMRDITPQYYRSLYDTVGADYLWWLRRAMPQRQLAALLRDTHVSVRVLLLDGREAGFYELDRGPWPAINLAYFGLMPHAVGEGLGRAFLRHAVDTAWGMGPRAVTVNTCTADHPRALPLYRSIGFRIVRAVDEDWPVPRRLGMSIPTHLCR
jgi:GNAT superfamily N-acetyltransferase